MRAMFQRARRAALWIIAGFLAARACSSQNAVLDCRDARARRGVIVIRYNSSAHKHLSTFFLISGDYGGSFCIGSTRTRARMRAHKSVNTKLIPLIPLVVCKLRVCQLLGPVLITPHFFGFNNGIAANSGLVREAAGCQVLLLIWRPRGRSVRSDRSGIENRIAACAGAVSGGALGVFLLFHLG